MANGPTPREQRLYASGFGRDWREHARVIGTVHQWQQSAIPLADVVPPGHQPNLTQVLQPLNGQMVRVIVEVLVDDAALKQEHTRFIDREGQIHERPAGPLEVLRATPPPQDDWQGALLVTTARPAEEIIADALELFGDRLARGRQHPFTIREQIALDSARYACDALQAERLNRATPKGAES